MMSGPRLLAVLALALLVRPSSRVGGQDRPTFTAESELVVANVMVKDRRGAAVSGLPQRAFTVFEDGRPQEIRFFSPADAPATIGLLIDNSTSMIDKRELMVASTLAFTELSNPDDEIFVLVFNEKVREIWSPQVIAKSDLPAMRETLTTHIRARGKTALYDAIAMGLERLTSGRHSRQVLVVISDGSDTASRTAMREVFARTQRADAAIFTVALLDPHDGEGNPGVLKKIATATGGESFALDEADEVAGVLQHIAHDIRSAYLLGYAPANVVRDGTLHKLTVVVTSPDGRRLKVRTREGYLAGRSDHGSASDGR